MMAHVFSPLKFLHKCKNEAAADTGGTCLGYMNNLQIILSDANYHQIVPHKITETTFSLHMIFETKNMGSWI